MLIAFASPLAIALVALTQVQVSETDDGFRLTSRASGKLYKSYVSRDAIRNSPAWDLEAESLPVSSQKAIKLAGKMRKSVLKSDSRKWEAASMHLLFDGDHCAWYVTFQAMPIKEDRRPYFTPDEVAIIVLMDGTVIKPVVADEEPPKKSQD